MILNIKNRINNSHKAVLKKIMWLSIISFVVTFIFTQYWFKTSLREWDSFSEAFVAGRVYQMQVGHENPGGFLMAEKGPEGSVIGEELLLFNGQFENTSVYFHQIGLQGTVLGVLNRVLCALSFQSLLRLQSLYFVVIWSFLAIFGSVCYWVYKEFGFGTACFLFFVVMTSSWTQRSIGNLYWVTSLLLLPFMVNLWICRYYEYSKKVPIWTNIIIIISLFIRFACGYEFTSTILISMEIPVIYYWIKHHKDTKKWFLAALYNGLAGIATFAFSIGAWLCQLRVYFGTWELAIREMLTPIATRTGLFSNILDYLPDNIELVTQDSLEASVMDIIQTYLTNSEIAFGFTMMEIIGIYILILTITLGVCAFKRDKNEIFKHIKLAVVSIVAFMAPISWHILGHGHSYFHETINYILWFLPFVPMVMIHMGNCVTTCSMFFTKPAEVNRNMQIAS